MPRAAVTIVDTVLTEPRGTNTPVAKDTAIEVDSLGETWSAVSVEIAGTWHSGQMPTAHFRLT